MIENRKRERHGFMIFEKKEDRDKVWNRTGMTNTMGEMSGYIWRKGLIGFIYYIG